MEISKNVSINYPETKEVIVNNINEVCKREHITVEEVVYFEFFFSVPGVCLFLRFWVGRWSTFLSVSCFILESRQMRYLNFYGKAQEVTLV